MNERVFFKDPDGNGWALWLSPRFAAPEPLSKIMSGSRRPDPRVTIVVTQREILGLTAQSLESLYTETDVPFSLVYVDAGSPPSVQSLLEREARRRGFKLLRVHRYVPPNVARDLALAHVQTEFVVFIDNDVLFSSGWLQALIDCADETSAAVVGPLYLEREGEKEKIHMAGGGISIEQRDGRRVFKESHEHAHVETSSSTVFERKRVDFVEFHCLLVRTAELRAVGGLDRRLLSLHEHIDLSMMLSKAGQSTYIEPRSVVTFEVPPPVARSEMSLFLRRWSERWARKTLKHFGVKWKVQA
ncbi:MAG: glycosyltransferase family 2 protein, partial [Actinomycetota bacterium]